MSTYIQAVIKRKKERERVQHESSKPINKHKVSIASFCVIVSVSSHCSNP